VIEGNTVEGQGVIRGEKERGKSHTTLRTGKITKGGRAKDLTDQGRQTRSTNKKKSKTERE